jgi:hypothetical protein
MADKVTIINRALTILGAEPINDITDTTLEANVANRIYDESRQSILAERLWTFATKRKLLNLVVTPLEWTDREMNFLYQLPSDIIRIFGVNQERAVWRVEQDKLLADSDDMGIIYTFDMTDTTKFTPSMVDAFADKLAADMSFYVNNSKTTTQQLLEKYEGVSLPKAESEDSQGQGTPKEIDDNLWSYAKYGFTPVNATGRRIA